MSGPVSGTFLKSMRWASAALDMDLEMPGLTMSLVKRGKRVEEWMWAKGSMWCKEGREEDGETSFTLIMGWWVVSGLVLKMKSRSGVALDSELLMSGTFLKPMRTWRLICLGWP